MTPSLKWEHISQHWEMLWPLWVLWYAHQSHVHFFLGQIMFNTLKVKTLNALWTIELLYCANPPSIVCGSPLSLQEIITKLLLSWLSLQNSIGKPSSIQQMKATFGLQTTCRRHQNSSSRSI